MLIKIGFNIAQRTLYISRQTFYALGNISRLNSKWCNLHVTYLYPQKNFSSIIFQRFKHKGKISKKDEDEEDEDEEDEDEEDEDEKDKDKDEMYDDTNVDDYLNTNKSKIIKTAVPSLRLDIIAKAGFGMSRAKLDKEFYKSNLRLNGQKCTKKSITVHVGDEIDLIRNRSPENPNYLIISRCVLASVNINSQADTIHIKLIQDKSLLIEDYTGTSFNNK